MKTRIRHAQIAALAALGFAGCASNNADMTDAGRRGMLELLMPSRIEIVEPFTRVKSFDENSRPDGIELLFQAVNSLDNPGLMVAGTIRVELFEYVPASAEQKGRRFEQWDVELATAEQQRRHWNQVTQMYEFQLGIDAERLPQVETYVLAVTYSSPLGTHLTDECTIEYRPGTGSSIGTVRR